MKELQTVKIYEYLKCIFQENHEDFYITKNIFVARINNVEAFGNSYIEFDNLENVIEFAISRFYYKEKLEKEFIKLDLETYLSCINEYNTLNYYKNNLR
ncbi:MAG: hypothetical protein ACRC5T_04160 [Cetobacterium sp.]